MNCPATCLTLAAGVFLSGSFASVACGCRYNVRDTAFVDVGQQRYTLLLEVPTGSETDPQLEQLAGDLDRLLAASNIVLRPEPVNDTGKPNATGRRGTNATLALVSPSGQRLSLEIDLAAPHAAPQIAALLFPTLTQPTADPLPQAPVETLLESHSLVLMLAADDAAAQEQLEQRVRQAIDDVAAGSALWPKAIGAPPRLITIPAADRSRLRVLLWAVGLDVTSAESQVVLLVGRGRPVGQPLTLDEVIAGRLAQLMEVVSMDCECETNVSGLLGEMLPHVWNDELQGRAATGLGFDPGHPLVIAEVRNILARHERKGVDGTMPAGEFELPAVGFREIPLPQLPQDRSTADPLSPSDTSGVKEVAVSDVAADSPSPVDNDWGAEEQTASPSLGRAVAAAILLLGAVVALGSWTMINAARRG